MARYQEEARVVLEQRTRGEYEGGVNYALQECTDVCGLV